MSIDINFDYIEDLGYESVGENIVESRPMRLGYPIPSSAPGGDAIKVPLSIAGQAGMLWMHNSEGDTATGDFGDSQSPGMFLNSGKFKLRKEELVYGSHIRVSPRDKGRSFIIAGLDEDTDAEYKNGYNPRPQSSINIGQLDVLLLQPMNPPDMRAMLGGGSCWWGGKARLIPPIFSQDWTTALSAVTLGNAIAYAVERDPALSGSGSVMYTEGSSQFPSSLSHQDAYNQGFLPQPSNTRIFYGWVKLIYGMTRLQHIINIIPATQVLTVDYLPLTLTSPMVIAQGRQYVIHSMSIGEGGSITFAGNSGVVVCV